MTGQGVLFRGVSVKCDTTPAGEQEIWGGGGGCNNVVLENLGGSRERRRG